MKLLLTTQVVDLNHPILGFFHTWIEKIAEQVDHLTVVCLYKGEYNLPDNVTVLSLGKEKKPNGYMAKLLYGWRFCKYVWKLRRDYDHVMVHMNPEYVILGGLLWRLSRKKVLLWYTHKSVNLKLRFAERIATKIFTASKKSFRLKSKKLEVVGHGINVDSFASAPDVSDESTIKLLAVGRISPVKDLETVILACNELQRNNPTLNILLDIVGQPVGEKGKTYKQALDELVQKLNLSKSIRFLGGIKYQDIAKTYKQNNILIHTSNTGSLDKVVLEAMASGLVVFTSSEAYEMCGDLVERFPKNNFRFLAESIENIIQTGIIGRNKEAERFVTEHFSLNLVINRIVQYFDL
jgi:glycosyltransferase involved in cell wall biosynthesis